jgi:hypothetical protein
LAIEPPAAKWLKRPGTKGGDMLFGWGLAELTVLVVDAVFASALLSRFRFRAVPTFCAWIGFTFAALTIIAALLLGILFAIDARSILNFWIAGGSALLVFLGARAMLVRRLSGSRSFCNDFTKRLSWPWAIAISVGIAAASTAVHMLIQVLLGDA